MPDYVRIVEVISGRGRDLARDEIDADAVATSRDLIVRLLTTGHDRLPMLAGYTLTTVGEVPVPPGRCLALTVVRDADGAVMAAIGAATHQRCGSRLWSWLRGAAEGIGIVPDAPERQPATPWAGYTLLPPVALPEGGLDPMVFWIRMLAQVLGWGWVDYTDVAA